MESLTSYFSSKNKKYSILIILSLAIIIVISIALIFRKPITLMVDGEERKVTTYKGTVQGALHENNIVLAPKDKVEPKLDSKISKNQTITIKSAVDVTVKVDGKNLIVSSAEDNVLDLLNAEGIIVDNDDKIIPSKDSEVVKSLDIEVVRVNIEKVKDIKPIPHETVVKKDQSFLDNYTKTLKEGKNGEKEVTSLVTYENGQEVSRDKVSEVVLKEPIAKEIVQGTLKTLAANRGSDGLNYKRKISNVKATAYSPINGAKTAYTASGMKALRNSNGYSTIAVDPSVIPLGSKVYVEGYGYAIAADTGTSVKGNFIDVFFNTYKEACNWGLKYLNVYILE